MQKKLVANNGCGDFFCIKKGNLYGLVDQDDNLLTDIKYREIKNTEYGIYCVATVDERWCLLDQTGKQISAEYDDIWGFYNHYANVKLNDKYALIHTSGKLVTDFEYDWIGVMEEGLACVMKNGKGGYINEKGEIIIELQYDDVSSFSDGLACVSLNQKNGFIDCTGKMIIDFQNYKASSFYRGLARICQSGKYGFIDKTGKIVIKPQYDYACNFTEENDLAEVEIKDELFLIDRQGTIVEKISSVNDGLFDDSIYEEDFSDEQALYDKLFAEEK